MKNSEIVAKYMALTEIINKNEKYPVKFSFALSKNVKTLESLNKDFEVARNGLLDAYNRKDDAGQPAYRSTGKIEIAPEHAAEWKKAMEELLEIEVDVSVHKIPLSVLDNITVEPAVLYACDFMIEE